MDDRADRLVIRPEDLPPEQVPEPQRRPPDRLPAVAAVLGVLSVLVAGVAIGPFAIWTGAVALRRAADDDERRRRLALLGLGGGLLGIVLWSAILFVLLRPVPGPRPAPGPTASRRPVLDLAALEKSPEPYRKSVLANHAIEIWSRTGDREQKLASGSGTAVAARGPATYLLTCAHVVRPTGPGKTFLRAVSARGPLESCEAAWISPSRADLAVLRCTVPSATRPPDPVPLGDASAVGVGERVFAVGNPLDWDGTVLTGIVSARRILEGVTLIQVQVPLNPGNSGGALYTEAGELVGVNSFRGSQNASSELGFSISLETLWTFLDQLPADVREALEGARAASGAGRS